MPVYEYRCEDCGRITEVLQKGLGWGEALTCPDCGGSNLTRLFSAPGMVRTGGFSAKGTTCCGRTERCDRPPCSPNGVCRKADL